MAHAQEGVERGGGTAAGLRTRALPRLQAWLPALWGSHLLPNPACALRPVQLREMERHRGQDAAHQQRMQAARKERDRRERERAAAAELSQAAGAARAAEAAADADATDTTWGRLRALTGAAAPEDVAGFWEGECGSQMPHSLAGTDGLEIMLLVDSQPG